MKSKLQAEMRRYREGGGGVCGIGVGNAGLKSGGVTGRSSELRLRKINYFIST